MCSSPAQACRPKSSKRWLSVCSLMSVDGCRPSITKLSHSWVLKVTLFDPPEIVDFGGLGGPAAWIITFQKDGGFAPILLEGILAARGRPDTQIDDFRSVKKSYNHDTGAK